MKKVISTILCFISVNMLDAQNVNIPDAVFKTKLVNNTDINTNGDLEIQVSEAAAFNGLMSVERILQVPPSGGPPVVFGPAITDLTGIEAFPALTGLICSRNILSSLNVSANTALTLLNCSYNELTSLNISVNTALTDLDCSSNQLTSLDVSINTALTILKCAGNQLTSLNLSSNTALNSLACATNQLTNLNVSSNTELTFLYCNQNQLTTLDVSPNSALTVLGCGSNQLTSLIVNNGNNSNFTYFDAINNPFLNCIQVDNVAYSNANWNFTDDIASFSTNCGSTSISDVDNLSALQIFPNPAKDQFTIACNGNNKNAQVNILDITGKLVHSEGASNLSQLVVNTGGFLEGIYMIQIQAEGYMETIKLIIKK